MRGVVGRQQRRSELTIDWNSIRGELLAMAEQDLRVRAELAADGSLFQGYHPRMRAVHDRHAARLARIMADHGWPGVPQVGPEGAEAAWLIVQHAIAQPTLQRRALDALRAAAARGEVPAVYAVMLEDRIRTFEGKPQRYGTQFDWNASAELCPLPIEDPVGLDERRRAVGLRPLAEEIQAQRQAIQLNSERAPSDWEARQREMKEWLRKVGWRD
jgi:hypothetical protein